MLYGSCPNYLPQEATYILAAKRRKKGYSGTGYPWELTPEEIVSILKRFPKSYDDSISSKFTFADVFNFGEFGKIQDKLHLDKNILRDTKNLNTVSNNKFRYLSQYLLKHPSLITKDMSDVIHESEILKGTFIVRQATALPAVSGESQLTISQDNTDTPLAKMELMTMEITEKLLDKASLALDYMTPQQIQKASIGTKAKMVENMIKSYTMFKSEGSNPHFTKINIKNMNVLQARELSRKSAE